MNAFLKSKISVSVLGGNRSGPCEVLSVVQEPREDLPLGKLDARVDVVAAEVLDEPVLGRRIGHRLDHVSQRGWVALGSQSVLGVGLRGVELPVAVFQKGQKLI